MIPLQDDTPSTTRPYVTYALIAFCVVIYAWQSALDAGGGQRVVDALGAIPAVLLTDARLPPELSWVPRYASCGIGAVLAQALGDPRSAYPIIGASGAISGVLGAYLLLFPRARVLTLVLLPFFLTTVRVPAMLLLLLWFAVQLLSDAATTGDASVAFRAHIGGFVAGMLLVPLLKRRNVRLFAS
jgi:membrane associated rhomboid family serine protease